MSEWEVGVNAPPFHVNCRTTTIPYFDDEFSDTGKRAARGEDGKTYYVPADTTYKEWEKAYVNGDKSGVKEVETDLKDAKTDDTIKLGVNLFDKNDPLYIDAASIEEIDGFEDIYLHGSPSSVQKKVDGKIVNMGAKEFAEYLKNDTNYSGGDIRLASCSTGSGENSFAQQLSKELGVRVMAPDDDVYYAPNEGTLFVGSEYQNVGKWRLFNKGVEE
jgi:ASC-1-like (ASCH) protein